VVRRRHRGGGLEAELWAAEHAVSDWLAALQLEGDESELFSIVADAATDAVDALVLEDDLADVDFTTLYGPWSDVMDAEDDDGAVDDEAEPAGGSGLEEADRPRMAARTKASSARTPTRAAIPHEARRPDGCRDLRAGRRLAPAA